MAYTPTPGRIAILTVATKDISPSVKTSTFSGSADTYDSSGYGVTNKTKVSGIVDGKFTASGSYDVGATTGTPAALEGQEGTSHAINRKVAGTGTGKPQEVFTGILTKFDVTAPVDEIVSWSAEWEVTGTVNRAVQP
jgi:hypothetical protein